MFSVYESILRFAKNDIEIHLNWSRILKSILSKTTAFKGQLILLVGFK